MIALYPYNDESSVAVLTSGHEVYKITVEETEVDDLTTTCSDLPVLPSSSLRGDFSRCSHTRRPVCLEGLRDADPLDLDDSLRLLAAQHMPLLLLPASASGEQLLASTAQSGVRAGRLPAEHASSAPRGLRNPACVVRWLRLLRAVHPVGERENGVSRLPLHKKAGLAGTYDVRAASPRLLARFAALAVVGESDS